MQIPQHTIEAIRDRTDIAEIVGQYVDLKRSGRRLVGLCPFHEESAPSFGVDPDKQLFYCFGCQKGGTVFNFLMEIEGISFAEAVRTLGRRCGIEVQERKGADQERSKHEAMFRVNAFAGRFYHHQLLDARIGKKARDYLFSRDIPESAWKTFGLGYAPDSWDSLWNAARRESLPTKLLAELRLISKSQKMEGQYYDYFRNRIMFPILSVAGRVVAFGARALGDGEPKYLNSSESAVFSKRRTFYGVDRARDAIRERRHALVVEGYIDLIRLHLGGFENTVAVCGTAMTPDHATVLRRMTQGATIVPDGDRAGENAAVAAGALMLAAGLDVRVARLEAGSDPDTALQSGGPEKFGEIVSGAMAYFEFLGYIITKQDLSVGDKETLIRRVKEGVASTDDRLRYDVIINELARILEVDPASLKASGPRRDSVTRPGSPLPPGGEDPKRLALEKLALRLMLEGTPAALDALDALDADDFSGETTRKYYKLVDLARESHIDIRSREFQRQAEEAGLEGLAAEVALIPLPPGNVATLLTDSIRRIKERKIRDELNALRQRLQELPSESEEAVAVAEYYHKLKQALVEL